MGKERREAGAEMEALKSYCGADPVLSAQPE